MRANQFSPDFAANLRFYHYSMVSQAQNSHSTPNINYQDSYFTAADLNPVYAHQDNWTKVDLQVALIPMTETWELAVEARPLTAQ